nr:hypothetical protein [Sphingomonas sp. SCN 67-18]
MHRLGEPGDADCSGCPLTIKVAEKRRVDMWIAGQAMSGTGLQRSFGGGLNWAPIGVIRLGAALEHADVVPSFDQLEAPLVTTVARVFDYTRRQVAEPIWTTGGNPGLQRGSRQTFTLSALLQPLSNQDLMLNLNYRRTVARAGGQGFPELSPAVEAAFPDRVTRDVSGQLIAVDARAINIVRDIDTSLLSGVALHFVSGGRDALQFTLSLNHNWRLKSETLIRPGVPVIDRLGGGGVSRHMLDVQLAAGKRGMGASVNMRWSGQASIDQGAGNDALRIRPPVILDASAFIDLDRYLPEWKGRKLGKNLNISLSIANLLNGYSHVRLQDGHAPAGFSRDEIDPLGRTIRLAVRKRF